MSALRFVNTDVLGGAPGDLGIGQLGGHAVTFG